PLNHSTTSAARKLLRWPPFWFSFLFLLYLTIQALNPSIIVVHGEEGWWVEKMQAPLASWLPTSVRSDYEPMNAFRVLEWFTASFVLMWGIWAGITRRKTAIFILWALVLSGSGMALVGILQDATDADKVLWTLKSANEHYWGSFFYRNQGAAYLNLMLIGIGFLYFYHAKNSAESGQSGGPHFLLFLLFALVVASVALALSRGGIIFAVVLSIGFIGGVILQALLASRHLGSSLIISILVVSLMGLGAYMMVQQVDFEAIKNRFGDVEATIENAEKDARTISTKATMEMAKDKFWLGWGAGSFRYIFPIYQQNYPEIFYGYNHKQKGWIGRRVYHYAHNDIAQFWAEYGVIGCGLLLLTFGTLLFSAFKPFSLSASSIVHFPLSTFHLMVGAATISAHAFVEFILNSPAYWVALVGLFVASAKLFQLEAARRRGGEGERLRRC
ncbi:MAG: O-antigen ligase family protein, partial [Opitutales bacterium]|nr:O-antigen ligase family protein [Opitutales bacterium]